jgi:hypothetical protein
MPTVIGLVPLPWEEPSTFQDWNVYPETGFAVSVTLVEELYHQLFDESTSPAGIIEG